MSGSSVFSKSSLNFWKFSAHVLWKPGLKDFEHHLASMWNEWNCAISSNILWHCPSLGLEWKLTFSSPVSKCWVFQICWHTKCSTLTALSFMYVKVLVAQLCLTLCNHTDCSPSGSSAHRILQERILEWVAIPFSRGSSWPRDQTWVSCTAGRFFTVWVTRETHIIPEWNRTTHALSLGQSLGFKSFREEGTQPSCLHLQERSRGYSGLSALQLPLVPFFTSSHFILTPFKCENWNWEALRDLSH